MDFLLNSVRMIDHDQAKEFSFGDIKSLEEHLAVAFVNPQDFKSLSLDSNIRISNNNTGEIVVKAREDETIPKGMIQMPVSIWSNKLSLVQDGEILTKNVKVRAEATNESITRYIDILKEIKEV